MKRNYQHLSIEERALIRAKLDERCTLRAIALSVQRSPSTISRELRRNGACERSAQPAQRGRPKHYQHATAQARAQRLASTPRVAQRLGVGDPLCPLWARVEPLLRARHSPEQIAGILRRLHPDTPALNLSHESLYTAIYAMPRGELRRDIVKLMRQGRAARRPRSRGKDRRGQIINMLPISERPSEVDERLVPGHWEGDLIKGRRNQSAVGTLVERTSLFAVLAKMPSAQSADCVTAFSGVLQRFDAALRLTLTYDRGREMAAHATLTENTGIKVFFADPHSPWQRGINENTNGLLREYLAKGADLSVYSQEQLDQIAWQLNTRPRKSLGWKCPIELFMPGTFDFHKHFSNFVALGA